MDQGDGPPPAYQDKNQYPTAPYYSAPPVNAGYPANQYPTQYGGFSNMGSAPPPPPMYGPSSVNVAVVAPGAGQAYRRLGSQSTQTHCPSCQAYVSTTVRYQVGLFTWLMCLGICLVGLDCGCCLLPFCVDQCQDAHHSCPNCNAHIGVHSPL